MMKIPMTGWLWLIKMVIMIYEDENGDSYTIDKEIALEILPLKMSASGTETEEDAGIGWKLIVSGCVFVAVMAAAAIFRIDALCCCRKIFTSHLKNEDGQIVAVKSEDDIITKNIETGGEDG